MSPDGNGAYVTNDGDASVSQYSITADGRLVAKSTLEVDAGDQPTAMAVSPDGKSAYVTNSFDATVSQYNVAASGALSPKDTPTVVVGTAPNGIAREPGW